MQTLLDAFINYFRGAQCIARYNLWGLALVPALAGLMFYCLVIVTILVLRYRLYDFLESRIDSEFIFLPFFFITAMVLGAGILYLAFVFFKYAVIVLSAPFMTLMSESIEAGMHPGTAAPKFSLGRFSKDLWRSFRINIRNFSIEMLWVLALFIVGIFFPPIFILGIILWLVQAYFAGFGNMDFTLERYCSYMESIRFVNGHKSIAVGNGIVFILIMGIPFIGALIAVPLATAASTLSVLKIIRSDRYSIYGRGNQASVPGATNL
jgi:CysZ protein